MLGGLIEDRYLSNQSKVPLLGDVPYLGGLFRSESRTRQRTNLMVFLRPTVMRDGDAANQLSLDRYDIIRAQQKDAQPRRNILLPINETGVLPPSGRVQNPSTLPPPLMPQDGNAPLSAPATSPGAQTVPAPVGRGARGEAEGR